MKVLLGTCVIFNTTKTQEKKWEMLQFRDKLIKKLTSSSNKAENGFATSTPAPGA